MFIFIDHGGREPSRSHLDDQLWASQQACEAAERQDLDVPTWEAQAQPTKLLVLIKVEHTDLGQALESVSSGRAYGAIHIGGNFSTTFETRFGLAGGYHISEDQARMSTISLHLDMSNQQILMTINVYLRKASEALLNNYFQARNMSTGGLNSVVELVPVYGSLDATFTDFVAPGMILT
ncbi:hypothetical protein ISCGN_028636 [Ixodes scapularis]